MKDANFPKVGIFIMMLVMVLVARSAAALLQVLALLTFTVLDMVVAEQ